MVFSINLNQDRKGWPPFPSILPSQGAASARSGESLSYQRESLPHCSSAVLASAHRRVSIRAFSRAYRRTCYVPCLYHDALVLRLPYLHCNPVSCASWYSLLRACQVECKCSQAYNWYDLCLKECRLKLISNGRKSTLPCCAWQLSLCSISILHKLTDLVVCITNM